MTSKKKLGSLAKRPLSGKKAASVKGGFLGALIKKIKKTV
jgi:hypothetical protein